MAKEQEVEIFLREFKVKMKVWDVVFRDDRKKNTIAMLELNLRPDDRKKILKNLKPIDYSEGPLEETLYEGSDMGVFGTSCKVQ